MQFVEVMKELEKLGTAQNRKVYARHGVGEQMFGVSYANQGKLQKKLKTDHALALQLWDSGIHDARVLATMIADPAALTSRVLDEWSKALDNYVLTDAFSKMAGQSQYAEQKMRKWIKSKDEWIGTAGWTLVSLLAMRDDKSNNGFLEELVPMIEAKIHQSKNRVRYAMNNALIAIGMRSAKLEKLAIAAAKRIGTVEVDHGETNCKTPEAVAYIKRARARQKR